MRFEDCISNWINGNWCRYIYIYTVLFINLLSISFFILIYQNNEKGMDLSCLPADQRQLLHPRILSSILLHPISSYLMSSPLLNSSLLSSYGILCCLRSSHVASYAALHCPVFFYCKVGSSCCPVCFVLSCLVSSQPIPSRLHSTQFHFYSSSMSVCPLCL